MLRLIFICTQSVAMCQRPPRVPGPANIHYTHSYSLFMLCIPFRKRHVVFTSAKKKQQHKYYHCQIFVNTLCLFSGNILMLTWYGALRWAHLLFILHVLFMFIPNRPERTGVRSWVSFFLYLSLCLCFPHCIHSGMGRKPGHIQNQMNRGSIFFSLVPTIIYFLFLSFYHNFPNKFSQSS